MIRTKQRQRGAITLIGALFIIVIIAVMVEVVLRMAASDILDTSVQHDAVEALFIAESGIEHASWLLGDGTACADLALASGNAGRGTFDVTSAVASGSDCQIRVTGAISTLGSQRTIQATLSTDGNLIAGANPDFNDPDPCVTPGGCMPTGWMLDDWDETGGPDGTRAAYVEKPSSGPLAVTSAGSFGLSAVTVTAPVTLTLEFDYRVDFSGGGGSTKAHLEFFLSDGTNTYTASPSPFPSVGTSGWETGSVSFDIGGSGPVNLTELSFIMEARPGQPKWIWLDNLVLVSSGGGPAVALRQWSEVVSN